MSKLKDDPPRVRELKDLLKEYLSNPNSSFIPQLTSYFDILIKSGMETVIDEIVSLGVWTLNTEQTGSPTVKMTGFGTNWINSLRNLYRAIALEDRQKKQSVISQLTAIVVGSDQDMSSLAALLLRDTFSDEAKKGALFSDDAKDALLDAYKVAYGSGRRVAIATGILKVCSDPEPFEKEVFPRIPSQLFPDEVKEVYFQNANIVPDFQSMKVSILEKYLIDFALQLIILDIGFWGRSWNSMWPDWIREKENFN